MEPIQRRKLGAGSRDAATSRTRWIAPAAWLLAGVVLPGCWSCGGQGDDPPLPDPIRTDGLYGLVAGFELRGFTTRTVPCERCDCEVRLENEHLPEDRVVRTDDMGRFLFTDVPIVKGKYLLVATCSDGRGGDLTGGIDYYGGSQRAGIITMAEAGKFVEGTVRGAGQPIAGAWVHHDAPGYSLLADPQPGYQPSQHTGADGRYRFAGLDDKQAICAEAPGFEQRCERSTAPGDAGTIVLDLDLLPARFGQKCRADAECPEKVCLDGTCQRARCSDHVQNGQETDVDCGGQTCPACLAVGKKCHEGSDCVSSVCLSGTCAPINGCDPATATDFTGISNAVVELPGQKARAGYLPRCLRVRSPNDFVEFRGDFSTYPLQAGVVEGKVGTPDTSETTPLPKESPLSTGTSKRFRFPWRGGYGFYCPSQLAAGMKGAVFVE